MLLGGVVLIQGRINAGRTGWANFCVAVVEAYTAPATQVGKRYTAPAKKG